MSGEVIRLLTDEERKAVESARTMTPLTLLMVVDTIKAEALREGAAEVVAQIKPLLEVWGDVEEWQLRAALRGDA